MSLFSLSGTRPTNLGVKDGKLAVCPSTPNCVCSQDPDQAHQIAPITYDGAPDAAFTKLKDIIQGMERAQIITEAADYLYAEFTSQLMGFVDDVEFYVDSAAQMIHVRAAARLGQSDLGVNRKRVETIRAQFNAV